jgi:hypothetical protein
MLQERMTQGRIARWNVSPVWEPTVAVGLGMFIYLALREPGIVAFRWVAALGVRPAVDVIRTYLAPMRSLTPDVVLFSLPTALWAFALVTVVAHIWRAQPGRARTVWLAITIALAIGLELGQLCGLVVGTFDGHDLVGTGLGVTIPLIRSRT